MPLPPARSNREYAEGEGRVPMRPIASSGRRYEETRCGNSATSSINGSHGNPGSRQYPDTIAPDWKVPHQSRLSSDQDICGRTASHYTLSPSLTQRNHPAISQTFREHNEMVSCEPLVMDFAYHGACFLLCRAKESSIFTLLPHQHGEQAIENACAIGIAGDQAILPNSDVRQSPFQQLQHGPIVMIVTFILEP